MIQNLVFDIGKVLVPFDWQKVYEDLFDPATAELVGRATVLDTEKWNELDRGSLPHEKILESLIASAPDYEAQIRQGVHEIYARMRPYPYAAGWLKALREAGYRIYLLSNFGKVPFETAAPALDFLPYTDGRVISYQVERIKPDPLIYTILCQKYRISPNQSVFIDDNRDNVQAAAELGFTAILFTGLEDACARLHEMGLAFDFPKPSEL